MAARGFAEAGDAAFVGNAALLHFLFVRPRSRFPARHRCRRGRYFGGSLATAPKAMAGGDAALLHRGRGEAREADDVAGGIDVRHRGLEGLGIDLEAAAAVGVEAALRRGSAYRWRPCGRRQKAPCRSRDGGRCRASADTLPLSTSFDLVEPSGRAAASCCGRAAGRMKSSMISWSMKSSNVDFGSIRVTARIERRKDRRIFDADDAGADDDHGCAAVPRYRAARRCR